MKSMLLLSALAGTGVLCAVLVTNHQYHELERLSALRQKQQTARWSKGSYIAIANDDEMRSGLLARIQESDPNGLLLGELREKLASSILSLCRAYSQADFDAFLEVRLPAPEDSAFEIQPKALEERKKSLPGREAILAAVQAGRRRESDRPVSLDSPLGVLEAWWYAVAPNVKSAGSPNPFYCLNGWRQFSAEKFRVLLERRESVLTNFSRSDKRLVSGMTILDIKPMLTARPSLVELHQAGKPVLFAHCLVPVTMDRRIKARPVLVSFYWSEAAHKFLACRLAMPASDLAVYYVF